MAFVMGKKEVVMAIAVEQRGHPYRRARVVSRAGQPICAGRTGIKQTLLECDHEAPVVC
jgi:hypothetical protein